MFIDKCSGFREDWRYLLALCACQATSPQLLGHLLSPSSSPYWLRAWSWGNPPAPPSWLKDHLWIRRCTAGLNDFAQRVTGHLLGDLLLACHVILSSCLDRRNISGLLNFKNASYRAESQAVLLVPLHGVMLWDVGKAIEHRSCISVAGKKAAKR